MHFRVAIFAILLAMLLISCSDGQPEPDRPSTTKPIAPTATPVPTSTLAPTARPRPTPASVPSPSPVTTATVAPAYTAIPPFCSDTTADSGTSSHLYACADIGTCAVSVACSDGDSRCHTPTVSDSHANSAAHADANCRSRNLLSDRGNTPLHARTRLSGGSLRAGCGTVCDGRGRGWVQLLIF